MVLSTSSTLSGKAASAETIGAAIEACRVVLHEMRRRIDATVTNTSTRNELRQSLQLAESALTSATRAAAHNAASAPSVPPSLPSSTQEYTSTQSHADRKAGVEFSYKPQSGGASYPSPSSHGVSPTSAPTSSAPPLPTRDDQVTRPTAPAHTQKDGRRHESPASAGDETWRENRTSGASFCFTSDRSNGEPPLYVRSKTPQSTAKTHFPLCSFTQMTALYCVVLSAVFWKRRKLTEYALTAMEALLRAVPIPQDLTTTLIVEPTLLNNDGGSGGSGDGHGGAGDRRGRRGSNSGGAGHRRTGRISVSVGTAVYYSLCECLTQSFSDPNVQTRALRLLGSLVEERIARSAATNSTTSPASHGRTSSVLFHPDGTVEDAFRNQAAMRTIEACYSVAVDGVQETVRHRARLVLRTAVQHIVRAFVTMQVHDEAVAGADDNTGAHTAFATDTILADYTIDVDHDEPFTQIHIVPLAKAAMATSPRVQQAGGFPSVGLTSVSNTDNINSRSPARTQAAADGEHGNHELVNRDSVMVPIAGDAPTAAPTPTPLGSEPSPIHRLNSDMHDNSGQKNKDALVQHAKTQKTPNTSPTGAPGNLFLAARPIVLKSGHFAPGTCSSGSQQFGGLSFNPHLFFTSSIDDSLVNDALSTLSNTDGAMPSSLKDMLMLLRRMCHCAIHPCSGTLSDSNTDIRARELGLWVLEITFEGFPVANCEQEHRCAVWMSLVMHACKYELLGCLARNLAMPAPFCFFKRALHLLEMLLRKLHYHLARELHTLLGAFLLPLMVSKYAGFRQKHAVLAMIRQLFAVPHLCVSFFVNYDCNPAFDAGAEYGGMLELLVEHVVEMTFLDHVNEEGDAYPWLTSDQQQLLRSECVVVINTFMNSLHRWIAEDPQEYVKALRRSAQKLLQRREQQQQKQESIDDDVGVCDAAVDEVAELYLDNWVTDEMDCPGQVAGGNDMNGDAAEAATGVGNSEFSTDARCRRSSMILSASATGSAVPHWGKNHNIEYHWKHIHYLLHDKRIAQEAVQRINAGNWQDAKTFLESRGYMAAISPSEAELNDPTTVGPGQSSYFLFAHFLFDYPGISRDSLSKIFENVNKKDGASRLVLTEYLHCFNYIDVPIDVAMRDTTCKFMSWDRPMFESKVWETVQKCFGAEYARQNPNFITVDDADTMAGVLLFLHSNLHNQIAKNNRMAVAQFVRDANDCLSFPLMEEDLQAMYNRVLNHKWELDIYGRTPQQAEQERTLVRLSAKIHMSRAAKWSQQSGNANSNNIVHNPSTNSMANAPSNATSTSTSGLTPPPSVQQATLPSRKNLPTADADTAALDDALQGTETESASCHSSFVANRSPIIAVSAPVTQSPNTSMDASSFQMWMSNDVALLDSTIPSYSNNKDSLKFKDEQHHAFLEVSAIYLSKLESVHRLYCAEGEAYRPQPYVVPYYAEHVRQMLLMTYPQVMSCMHMGFRILEEAPIARKLLDTLQVTYDIAAAFVLNLRDLRPVMEEALQRYLSDERAYKLLPPSRATFVPMMLNIL